MSFIQWNSSLCNEILCIENKQQPKTSFDSTDNNEIQLLEPTQSSANNTNEEAIMNQVCNNLNLSMMFQEIMSNNNTLFFIQNY